MTYGKPDSMRNIVQGAQAEKNPVKPNPAEIEIPYDAALVEEGAAN